MTLSPDKAAGARTLGPARWAGTRGRVEVWYATFTDEATGTGYWLHYETVAPVDAGTEPYNHGWAAVFAPAGEPRVERFGPCPVRNGDSGNWFSTATPTATSTATPTATSTSATSTDTGGTEAIVGDGRLAGRAGAFGWDLTFDDASAPLYTFGRPVWERQLLPGAQCVPWPAATFRGTFDAGEGAHQVEGRGALARIYGHSNAQRWCWLHADLDGGPDSGPDSGPHSNAGTLELVAATARRPGLRRLPPLAMVQLRLPGERDRPRVPALAALFLRTRIKADGFTVSGFLGTRRLRIDVKLPPSRCTALVYTDPDASTATCTNSELADATVTLRRPGRGAGTERRWEIVGRAHAEIGRRP